MLTWINHGAGCSSGRAVSYKDLSLQSTTVCQKLPGDGDCELSGTRSVLCQDTCPGEERTAQNLGPARGQCITL